LFAQHGYETTGIDISGSAIHEAKKWVSAQKEKASRDGTSKDIAPCKFILTDFFQDEWLKVLGYEGCGAFDLVYDYAVSLLLYWI
jgi:hypothetical protein